MQSNEKVQKYLLLILITVLVMVNPLFAEDGQEIMQKVFDAKAPEYSHSAVKMELINSKGETQTRMMEEWGKEENSLLSTVIIFRSPSSVKNTRFLQVQNEGKDDDKWIYLPTLRTVRRIASSDGDKSFMGTDATYDDLTTREVNLDKHEYLSDEKIGSYDCFKVKSTAKDSSTSQYGYLISYVDKESFVPIKVEMYDKNEDLLKVLTVDSLDHNGIYWIPMINTMTNVQTGHSTKLSIVQLVLDEELSPKMFTPTFLKTGRI